MANNPKVWTAEDIEKIWNDSSNGVQTKSAPLPTLNNTSKINYTPKEYEKNKKWTGAEIEQMWKTMDAGKAVASEQAKKSTYVAPKYGNKVPTKEEVAKRKIAEGRDDASLSLKRDRIAELKAKDRRDLTREEEAKLKKAVKQENAEKKIRNAELNNVSRNVGDNNISRYNKQFSLNKPVDKTGAMKLAETQNDPVMRAKNNYNNGRYGKGNIDLTNRPKYVNEDGSISTVRSMSFNENGKEILVPTIAYDNNGNAVLLSDDEAIKRYHDTGEYLGKFNTVDEANAYAEKLHRDQESALIKDTLNKEADNYFKSTDTREGLRYNQQHESQFVKHMARTYGYSKDEVKDFLKEYKNESLKKEYLVSRDRYNALMQDERLKSDIDNLAMAMANGSNAKNVGKYNLQSMGYNSVDDYIDQLSKRYELTEDELKDMVKTYTSDREQSQANKLNEGMYALGQKAPWLATPMSIAYKGGAGVEGWYNTLNALTTGDDRNQSHIFNAMANATQQGAADTIDNPFLKQAYNFGVGGASAALNAGAGAFGIMAQAGNAANQATQSAIDRGINLQQAGGYGLVAGGTDYLFNRVGFNAIEKGVSPQSIKSGKDIAKKMLVNFNIEGAENVAQDITQSIADGIINGNNSELNVSYANYIESGMSPEDAFAQVAKDYASQLGESYATGGIGGALFGALKGDYIYDDGSTAGIRAFAKLKKIKTELNSGKVNSKVIASEIDDAKTEIDNVNNAIDEAKNNGDAAKVEELTKTIDVLNKTIADLEEKAKVNDIPRIDKIKSLLSKPDVMSKVEASELEDAEAEAKANAVNEGNAVTEQTPIDVVNQINGENPNAINSPVPTVPANNPNKVMAEDIGLRGNNGGDNGENRITYSIEEEPMPKKPYKQDGVSQFATDTMINSGIFDEDTLNNNPDIAEMAKLVKEGHTDADTFNGAMDRVTSNGVKWLKDIVDGKYVLGKDKEKADLDFDTGMILMRGLKDKIDSTTDPAEVQALNAQFNLLYDKMQRFSTSAARVLHAHKKWNTEEGAILEANNIIGKQTESWKSRNKDVVEQNDKLADKLSDIKKKGKSKDNLPINKKLDTAIRDLSKVVTPKEEVEKTHEQIIKEIKNTLKKHGLDRKFSKERLEVLENYIENIPTWQLTDQLRHFFNTGDFYSIDESTKLAKAKSTKLANALSTMGDKTPKAEKEEIGFAKRKERVINTLEDEYGSIEGLFPDNKINELVDLEEKLPAWQLRDELEHYFLHGDFYPITENVNTKPPTAKWLTNIINNIDKVEAPKAEKTPQSFDQMLEEVRNSFESESSSIQGIFGENDYQFITMLKQEGYPAWVIEDEIRYKMENGTFYSIDESINEPKPTNSKLKSALTTDDGSFDDVEKVEPTFEELVEQVRNTFDEEPSSLDDLNEDDYQYFAGLIQNGATKEDLAEALNTRSATGKYGVSVETRREVGRIFKYMSKLNPESKDYADAQMEAFRLLANEAERHASAVEKFDAWRYLAMLGNPKTMVRNAVGNLMSNGIIGVKNTIAALGETALNKHLDERTKSVLVPFLSGKLKKAGRQDFMRERYASGAGDKYHSIKRGVESATSAFDNHIAQFFEELTNKGISDTGFVKLKYGSSLAGYLKANGMSEADLEASYKYEELKRLSRSKQLTKEEYQEMEELKPIYDKVEKGRDYALEQAKYATFHEDNVVAELLSQHINEWKQGKIKIGKKEITSPIAKAIGYGAEGVLPFRKTPANILRTGFEFSPLGAIKSIAETGKLIYENTGKRKNYDDTYTNRKGELVHKTLANDVIDDWSKNLTGSLMSVLGYYLFSKGILKDSDKETKYQDQLEGLQNYSIEINGKTYTIDWAAPACMPLLLGAEWAKIHRDNAISDKKFYDDPERYWETANKIFEPMVETSMLQGVKDTLETAANATKYNEDLSVPTLLAYNALTGYATQAVPTVSGQLARLVDPTRRSTYTEREGMGGILEKQGRKMLNKIPFASKLNQPYYDAYGRPQSNNVFDYQEGETLKNIGRGLVNAAYQFASPSYIADVTTTDADRLTREVYDAIKKDDEKASDVFASGSLNKKIDGQRLSAEDNAKYTQKRGETDYAIRDALAHDEWFAMLDKDEQGEILKSISKIADKVGEAQINPNFETKDKAYKAYSEGDIQGLVDYYKDTVHTDRVKEELGTTSDFAKELYDSGDQTRIDKYKTGSSIGEEYGYDTLTEDEYLNYEKYGEQKLRKMLNYKSTAKELGVNNNDTFKKLVDSGVSNESIKKASDAITSVPYGKDEFGRQQYLPFSEETYNVYKKSGTAGLKDYATIKQGKANYNTYAQAKTQLPTLIKDSKSYVKMFTALDGKAGSKADGTISQKELLKYFNGRDMSQAQVDKYWKAFGDFEGKDAWKSKPVYKLNKKTGKYEWKSESSKKK